jgi:hypothetical protein
MSADQLRAQREARLGRQQQFRETEAAQRRAEREAAREERQQAQAQRQARRAERGSSQAPGALAALPKFSMPSVGAFTLAWLTGMGIIGFRSVRVQGGPPWPGQLLAASGLYVVLAMVGEAGPNARKFALTLAWGMNIAAFMNLGWKTQGSKTVLDPSSNLSNPAEKGWWTKLTQTRVGPGTIIPFGSGDCGPGTPGSNFKLGPGGSGIPGPGGIPVPKNCPRCSCLKNYYYHNGRCYSAAVNLPPKKSTLA